MPKIISNITREAKKSIGVNKKASLLGWPSCFVIGLL